MLESITNILKESVFQPLGLVFALILGTISAVTSVCCTVPALGILLGYSGTRNEDNRKAVLKSALFFVTGTILSLIIVGVIAGFIGQVAQNILGFYWKLFAGFIAIFMGLITINFLPFKLSFNNIHILKTETGIFGKILSGFVIGGVVAVSSLPCNPGIFIIIGAAILQGNIMWAILLMAMFAIGFSIPLGAVFTGISLYKITLTAKRMDVAIRWVAGLLLIIFGFYFLIIF